MAQHSAGETQPKTYKVTLRSLLLFPFRLCNPPPAVGKVRSCSVTPAMNVRLEDVLDRKHLPPLGLKDFEEWLLYVEFCPENLYFILWLRDYTVKYSQWDAMNKTRRRETPQYLGVWPSQHSTQLAMFYARAKQTFLTPNANHELNLPSDILAPFHTANGSPHPDPAIFNQVAVETRKMLNESLQRFVAAAAINVGTNRVLCGIIAGVVCCLVGALFPLLYTIFLGGTRWIRLASLPGLWLGFTLLLTSLNGICLAVYVFGDLRQLRKFELSRPPISKPQPLYSSRRHPIGPSPVSPPPPARLSASVDVAVSVHSTSTFDSSCEIQISPAYYEVDPVEGAAIAPITRLSYPLSEKHQRSGFDDDGDSKSAFPTPKGTPLPEQLQPISEFDFDVLPTPPHRESKTYTKEAQTHQVGVFIVPEAPQLEHGASPKAFIRRIQSKCNINRWLVVSSNEGEKDSSIRKQFKKVKAVPAFASPLTKILSPVVVRTQWEIVVRSMLIAFVLSGIIVGSLLAVPVLNS
ncbi:hypothetical protein BDZ89DRAFT_1057508 [Hymenopellis radicata]|nr:hypothetical protein BDZ89DRAFT_1057508 [Hymenopellis radicata]